MRWSSSNCGVPSETLQLGGGVGPTPGAVNCDPQIHAEPERLLVSNCVHGRGTGLIRHSLKQMATQGEGECCVRVITAALVRRFDNCGDVGCADLPVGACSTGAHVQRVDNANR
jgi:hypothetical protein